MDEACAYEDVQIDKLAWSGLEAKAPDVVETLRKLRDPVAGLCAGGRLQKVKDPVWARLRWKRPGGLSLRFP